MGRAAAVAVAAALTAVGCDPPEATAPSTDPAPTLAAVLDAGPATLAAAAAAGVAAAAAPERAFGPEVRALRLRRSTVAKLGPDAAAKNLGAVAADTRVAFGAAVVGPGCTGRWIAIEPRGWVCEDFLAPVAEPPLGVELPKLARGELIPGAYGKVTGAGARIATIEGGAAAPRVVKSRPASGSVMVRRLAELTIGGVPHWLITKDEAVAVRAITPLLASPWQGVRLGDDTGRSLPLGFAVAEKHVLDRVPVWADPAATTRVRTLDPRAVVPLAARDEATGAIAIGDGEWLRAADLRPIEAAPPPSQVVGDERWIDVDLDRQLLIAYEGALPVYATLVSTGRKKNPTETGVYRVWIKFAETDMNGQMNDEPAYSVATVPWTQFYAKDLALHTAYWHDRFGTPRSHGCVNLSPIDARFLYFWSGPDVPPGWSMAHGVVERPGSLIRVRSAADPDPPLRGYAARVAAAAPAPATAAPAAARSAADGDADSATVGP